jgi:hypothetical protein
MSIAAPITDRVVGKPDADGVADSFLDSEILVVFRLFLLV